mmetsp:Transcript_22878/g.36388  ORF Transcript_22878/g.36388 Transcript_22878/m.36388 type:complete len:259 (-) Transcript_22878:616-1392(-)
MISPVKHVSGPLYVFFTSLVISTARSATEFLSCWHFFTNACAQVRSGPIAHTSYQPQLSSPHGRNAFYVFLIILYVWPPPKPADACMPSGVFHCRIDCTWSLLSFTLHPPFPCTLCTIAHHFHANDWISPFHSWVQSSSNHSTSHHTLAHTHAHNPDQNLDVQNGGSEDAICNICNAVEHSPFTHANIIQTKVCVALCFHICEYTSLQGMLSGASQAQVLVVCPGLSFAVVQAQNHQPQSCRYSSLCPRCLLFVCKWH